MKRLILFAPMLLVACLGNPPNTSTVQVPTAIHVESVTTTATTEVPTDIPSVVPSATFIASTTLIFTGDVMLGRGVRRQYEKNGGPNWPFLQTRDLLSSADISVINLEGTYTDPCPHMWEAKVFCTPSADVSALQFAGIDVANVANNHILDYGQIGYESTLTALESVGVKPSDADHLVIITKNGIKFGFIGFGRIRQSSDYVILSSEETARVITDAKTKVDFLVVSFHFGEEYQSWASTDQIAMGNLAVDSGADLVVGTHPHVRGEFVTYKGKLIYYSLGNFIFDNNSSPATTHGNLLFVTVLGTVVKSELIPIEIMELGQPMVVPTPSSP